MTTASSTSSGIHSPESPARAGSPGSPARRLLERFALIAFGLYHLPLFLNNYPSLGGGGFNEDGLAVKWGHVFTPVGMWVARTFFGMTGPMPGANAGDNGDVGEEFGRLLVAVAVGVIGAMAWTFADRNRPRGAWVEGALRVMLRYSIALGLASYAIAKILPMQFPALDWIALETRVGDLTPMRLLWNFMQYSRPYAFFGGLMELTVVLLLCFRRTSTLGALTCLAVMTNVALMNLAYGVQVKLYSLMIVASAAVLVLYEAPRLLAVFVKDQAAPAAPQPSLFEGRLPEPMRWAIKALLVGSVLLSSWVAMAPAVASRNTAPSGLDGAWIVTSFARDGKALDSTANPARWRRLIIAGSGAAIRFETDTLARCRRTVVPDSTTLAIACSRNRMGELTWTRSGNVLHLDGRFDGANVAAVAQHLDPGDYALLRARFRWIFDR